MITFKIKKLLIYNKMSSTPFIINAIREFIDKDYNPNNSMEDSSEIEINNDEPITQIYNSTIATPFVQMNNIAFNNLLDSHARSLERAEIRAEAQEKRMAEEKLQQGKQERRTHQT